jgi:hypothetical protein
MKIKKNIIYLHLLFSHNRFKKIKDKNYFILLNYMNFDWKFYIERYPSLKENGIVNEKEAIKHWEEYGQKEGKIGCSSNEKKLSILYLVNRESYLTKMSRVRFHGCKALSKISNFKYWGLNWDGYNQELTVQENINNLNLQFDIVFAYKPLELKGFKDLKFPKGIRYNEMFDIEWTLREINESGSQFVVCHHKNDYDHYRTMNIPNVHFVYVGHCAEKTIFKNYKIPYEYDIMLVGRVKNNHYPLRNKFLNIFPELQKKYSCYHYPHPGYNNPDSHTDRYLIEMSKAVNKAKIVLTDTGKPRSRYGKYIEIPMCGTSALCGDFPNDDADDYSYVINVSLDMSEQEIIDKISYYLDHEVDRQKKIALGLEFSKKYTQEDYAERLLREIHHFLN